MIRIAVTGPESTGKSWLAGNLARHYGTIWVPEYAREYLNTLQRPYRYGDLLKIAKGQWSKECEAESLWAGEKDMLICDTEFIVLRIWSEVKFGKCHPWIQQMAESHIYNHYLLCNIDLPWEYDPQREHPGLRAELFGMYKFRLDEYRFPYTVISGQGAERLNNAIKAIDGLL